MQKLPPSVVSAIANKEKAHRSLSDFLPKIDFYSNDYLGLAQHAANDVKEFQLGSSGSRLISGNHTEIVKAETFLADFFGSESALLLPSGYQANVALFSCLPQKGEVVLYDEFIHASIRDGLRLSNADSYKFKHNDLAHLETLLNKWEGKTIYIATESIFSMDGDAPDIKKLCSLAKQYGAFVLLDEAHGAGVFGEQGRGLANFAQVSADVLVRIIPFGKAYGFQGAVLLMPENLKHFMVNFSRGLIFTTGVSPLFAALAQQLVQKAADMNQERKQLQRIAEYAYQELKVSKPTHVPFSPILPLFIEDDLKEKELLLRSKEVGIKAIYTPTVPLGKERFRVVVHAFNTTLEVDLLLRHLWKVV